MPPTSVGGRIHAAHDKGDEKRPGRIYSSDIYVRPTPPNPASSEDTMSDPTDKSRQMRDGFHENGERNGPASTQVAEHLTHDLHTLFDDILIYRIREAQVVLARGAELRTAANRRPGLPDALSHLARGNGVLIPAVLVEAALGARWESGPEYHTSSRSLAGPACGIRA